MSVENFQSKYKLNSPVFTLVFTFVLISLLLCKDANEVLLMFKVFSYKVNIYL